MPTNFPNSLDTLTNPTSGSLLTSPDHAAQHTNANDAIEAIEQWALDYETGYVEKTTVTSITATTEATANTIVTAAAKTFNGTTIYLIEFFSPACSPAGTANASINFFLYDGASSIGNFGAVTTTAAAVQVVPVRLTRRLTPSAASHTYSIRASVSSGTGNVQGGTGGVGTYTPAFIRITRAN